jgi:hypothetical protein
VKSLVVICLALAVVVSAPAPAYSNRADEEPSPFTLAQHIGAFHLFSTSIGKYTISRAGWGEVYVGNRKKNFQVKVGARERIERLYFFEYEGDLLLLYEAGASGYLVRLDQKTRKAKRATAINENFEPPLLKDQSLFFSDGTVVPLD